MIKKVLGVSVLAAAAAAVGCEKDAYSSLKPRERGLVVKAWSIVDVTRKSLLNPEVDSSVRKSCTIDDRLLFRVDRTFALKDHTTACDSALLAYDAGSWTFDSTGNYLVLAGNRRLQKWKIVMYTDSSLQVQWKDSVSPDNKVLKTIYFKNR